jgi:hypothetical protein
MYFGPHFGRYFSRTHPVTLRRQSSKANKTENLAGNSKVNFSELVLNRDDQDPILRLRFTTTYIFFFFEKRVVVAVNLKVVGLATGHNPS